MKYRADQLSNGNYAVFSGKSYYPDTETLNSDAAKKLALQMSAQWYYEQAEKAFKQAEEEGLLGEYDNSLGDWLC
jgi:hypothetical protein